LIDLTDMFGEGWCLTLAPMEAARALALLGSGEVTVAEDGLRQVTDRLESGDRSPDVLLLGRDLRDGWSLVMELEGTIGWVGVDERLLAALSVAGNVAVSAFADPNQTKVYLAANGQVVCELDADVGYLGRGADSTDPVVQCLIDAGFSRDDEPGGRAAATAEELRAVLALQAVTGVELTEEDFAGPWLSVLASPPA
jgi:hypothetical protein